MMKKPFEQLSVKNQACQLAREATGDLAVVRKIKGDIVAIMRDELRETMSPAAWAEEVGRRIRIAIPGWVTMKVVNGLMIFRLKYGGVK